MTPEQEGGLACIVCNRNEEPMLPLGHLDGIQVFGHEPCMAQWGLTPMIITPITKSGIADCACCDMPVMTSDISKPSYCEGCVDENCDGTNPAAWHCPTGRCAGTLCDENGIHPARYDLIGSDETGTSFLIMACIDGERYLAGRLAWREGAWQIYHVSDAVYGQHENPMEILPAFIDQFTANALTF